MKHDVDALIHNRKSTRVFLERAVEEELVRNLLDVARWAPSGSNMQPWRVTVLAGEPLQTVCDIALKTLMSNPKGEEGEYPIYPPGLKEPYRSLRFETGELMYEKLGIPREDKPSRLKWLARNFQFFGAPVGLLFSIDRTLTRAQWAHLGMFMQTFAIAAEAQGLATCMQESWGHVRDTIHTHLGLPESDVIYAGIALGYADPEAPVNTLRTPRSEVDAFTSFHGF